MWTGHANHTYRVDRRGAEGVSAELFAYFYGSFRVHRPVEELPDHAQDAAALGKPSRPHLKGHRPAVLWLTGLSGAGKSTIATGLGWRLSALGAHTYLLDGDTIRGGLNRDLGFTDADRVENIRRVAEVASLFADAGLIAIVSLISPFRFERQRARERVGARAFVEIFVDTPLEECRARDPKGLYAKAAAGELLNFTGVDSPYEPPEKPELRLTTIDHRPEELVETIIAYLHNGGILHV